MSFFWLERPPFGGSILGPTSIKVSRAEGRSSEEGEPRTAGQGTRRTPSGRLPPPEAGGAPGDGDDLNADAQEAAALILSAGRRQRADEREPLDVEPEAEAAARFVLEADAPDEEDEDAEAAARAILDAGQ